jgi:hypothetical protein
MNERLYFTTDQKLKWFCLKTFERDKYKVEPCCSLHSCIQLNDGRVLISSSIEIKKGTKSHMMFIYEAGKMNAEKEPSLGITGLQMININTDIFYISGNRCEKHCMLTNQITTLENLNFNHIKAGCCTYNRTIAVISGINCQAIEIYNEDRNYWINTSSLSLSLFDFSCVQIGEEEVLGINYKRTYRIFIETGECVCTTNYNMDVGVVPVLRGDYVFSLNAQKKLVRYSLKLDRWLIISRSGCCIIY